MAGVAQRVRKTLYKRRLRSDYDEVDHVLLREGCERRNIGCGDGDVFRVGQTGRAAVAGRNVEMGEVRRAGQRPCDGVFSPAVSYQ